MGERRDAPSGPGPSAGGAGGGGPPGGAGAAQEDRTLYVGNLPYDVSQQEVTALFTDNALLAPVRIHLPLGPDGRLRGFGFVTCANADAANQSLGVLRNLDVRGRRLMVNIAHPRGASPGGPGGRPPPGSFAGGGGSGGSAEPRFSADAASGDAARAVDPRRARNFGPPAPPGGGGGGDWADKKKKKGRKGGEGAAGGAKRERGGGGQRWGNDPDDE